MKHGVWKNNVEHTHFDIQASLPLIGLLQAAQFILWSFVKYKVFFIFFVFANVLKNLRLLNICIGKIGIKVGYISKCLHVVSTASKKEMLSLAMLKDLIFSKLTRHTRPSTVLFKCWNKFVLVFGRNFISWIWLTRFFQACI